ncbi:MAG TPA: M3 family oligoendopeptidase [Bellilinea sp.]|nr:M3 family oligoendopeptidase [Bellilinea sp.]
MPETTPPRWDLSNVFPGLDSPEFLQATNQRDSMLTEMEALITSMETLDANSDPQRVASQINHMLTEIQKLLLLENTLGAYLHSFVSTDSFNKDAMRKMSEYEKVSVRSDKIETRLRAWIGKIAPLLPQVTALPGTAQEHAFWLKEVAEQSRFLMSQPEEALAAELNLSGANAWQKLQGTVTSQLTVEFGLDCKVQTLPMPALINLRSHPDEDVRRRAYEAESAAWDSVKEPLAAALNGVKGMAVTLNQHRGRTDALHSALDINRIDRQTLDAMLTAMKESLPMFGRYFQSKAKKLGKDKLPWWDLFAPGGKTTRTYTYEEARAFVIDNFGKFSPDLSNFARRAFDGGWIDAEQRSGKRGGAFCMSVPGVKESRVLMSFDGSLDVVSTLAHELGHAFHNDCMFTAGRTELQRTTPMALAETASIMCETIVVEEVLAQAKDPDEVWAILESALTGDSQVIVDIYSRFLFESEIFKRREQAELSADEFCEIMEWAQKEAYGDGLDQRYLQKWMWTWKPHYYSSGLSFYNFPYAFGLLFGTGLYAIFQQRGAEFVPEYKALLASTGMGDAATLAARFGIDIRQPDFWRSSLGIIGKRVERFVAL